MNQSRLCPCRSTKPPWSNSNFGFYQGIEWLGIPELFIAYPYYVLWNEMPFINFRDVSIPYFIKYWLNLFINNIIFKDLQHFIIYQDIRVAKTIVYSSPELESLFYDFSVGLGALVAYLVFQ